MAVWKPLSIQERQELAKQLRKEAAEKIAEAERIEKGVKDDQKIIDDAVKATFEKIKWR